MPAQQLPQGLFAQRLGRLRTNGSDDGLRELCELVVVLNGRQGDGVKEFDTLRCDERGQRVKNAFDALIRDFGQKHGHVRSSLEITNEKTNGDKRDFQGRRREITEKTRIRMGPSSV